MAWRLLWRLLSPPEVEEVDRTSNLPDDIIHRIFSFLPFKDVVKTSLLSRQWRFAWTSTPYIDVSLSQGDVRSINRAISRRTAAKIEKSHLNAALCDSRFATPFPRWDPLALASKVEDISLDSRYWYDLPRFLCECTSLGSLQVSGCGFSKGTTIYWPSLKKLCISDYPLGNDDLMKILSGSPVLESLTLRFPRYRFNIRIDSRSLRELVIEGHMNSLEISAPNLLSLRLSIKSLEGFRLHGVSSLAEAELNFSRRSYFHDYLCDQLNILLEQLRDVPKITLGRGCLEILSLTKVLGTSNLTWRWSNVIVYTRLCKSHLLGMEYLLQNSPLMESLVISNPGSDYIKFEDKDFPELHDFDEMPFWGSQKELYCVANHLKRVEIIGFQFPSKKPKPWLVIAKFLLEEATGLEKMIMDVVLNGSIHGVLIDPYDLWNFQELIQLQEGLPKASQDAQVIVKYRFIELPSA